MKNRMSFLLLIVISVSPLLAEQWESLPADSYFAAYRLLKAPPSEGRLLKQGDRLAICGDSITEQKMYSRIMETYLTVCVPQLHVAVRQFGWSGEKAPGLQARLENDVLRFEPTIATTCYAMNDHNYQPYKEEYGRIYRDASRSIIRSFKARGTRVIQGSAGTVGKMPSWVKWAEGTVDDLNHSLAVDFPVNPFSAAFARVDDAVARKQAYETRQIKTLFHGPEGRADMPATVALTEKTRAPLVEAVGVAFVPVRHSIRIEPE